MLSRVRILHFVLYIQHLAFSPCSVRVTAVIVALSVRIQSLRHHHHPVVPRSSLSPSLCAKHTTATALPLCRLSLHLLGDLDVDFKKLGYATVKADGFALVQIAFAVCVGNAFLSACIHKSTVISVSCRPFVIMTRQLVGARTG